MRTNHGALLLVLAMVMAMLSTGICIGTAPAPAPAPTANSLEYPHVYRCWETLSDSGCDQMACDANCFIKLKGTGACTHLSDRVACWCFYPCKLPHPPAW